MPGLCVSMTCSATTSGIFLATQLVTIGQQWLCHFMVSFVVIWFLFFSLWEPRESYTFLLVWLKSCPQCLFGGLKRSSTPVHIRSSDTEMCWLSGGGSERRDCISERAILSNKLGCLFLQPNCRLSGFQALGDYNFMFHCTFKKKKTCLYAR